MAQYGLMIDYEWCSGCQSCELACKNEHNYSMNTWGIKVMEFGPYTMTEGSDKVEWNYVPFPTNFCDMCEQRIARNEVPSCALHCLSGVIEWGTTEELAKKMEQKGSRCMMYLP